MHAPRRMAARSMTCSSPHAIRWRGTIEWSRTLASANSRRRGSGRVCTRRTKRSHLRGQQVHRLAALPSGSTSRSSAGRRGSSMCAVTRRRGTRARRVRMNTRRTNDPRFWSRARTLSSSRSTTYWSVAAALVSASGPESTLATIGFTKRFVERRSERLPWFV